MLLATKVHHEWNEENAPSVSSLQEIGQVHSISCLGIEFRGEHDLSLLLPETKVCNIKAEISP